MPHEESNVVKNIYELPLPEIIHQTIPEQLYANKKVAIIGDVHGCLAELKLLIEEYDLTTANTLFVFAGDMINKGPYNCETLVYIRDVLGALAVRGNHEEHVLKHIIETSHGVPLPVKYDWIKHVGFIDIKKVDKQLTNAMHIKDRYLRDSDIEWLHSLPYTIVLPGNRRVIHAGINPYLPFELQQYSQLTTIKENVHWSSLYGGQEHIYYGHYSKAGLMQRANSTGLDTGVVYGGRLTAAILDVERNTHTIISVGAINKYKNCKRDSY